MNKILKWVGLGFISLLAVLSVSVFGPSQKALAATPTSDEEILALKSNGVDGTLVNMSYISLKIGGVDYTFKDDNPFNGNHEFGLQDGGCGNGNKITLDYNKPGPIGGIGNSPTTVTANLDINYIPPNGKCQSTSDNDFEISLAATGNNVWFEYVDDTTIIDLAGSTFKPSTVAGVDSKLWVKDGVDSCASLLIVNGSSLRYYKLMSSGSGFQGKGYEIDKVGPGSAAILAPLFPDTCRISTVVPWSFTADEIFKDGKLIFLDLPIGDRRTNNLPSGGGGLPGDEGGGAIAEDCYSGLRSSLAWIICPILGVIDNFIEWAERAIEGQLTVDLGDQEARESLQEVWRIMARLASGILVIIALVMVIATALGSDLISPYALKKVLPRLVIGAIGIWLSWALVVTYIDIMNDLGKGVEGIMLTPFAEVKEFSLQNIAGIAAGPNQVATSGTIFVVLATVGIATGGIFGLLGAGLTAVFAFLVAIIVLALRQAVIVFLVILAPLGFAMWILPNTNKIWKLWSGTLNKLLIMFPMIMGILTAGKIFAYITAKSAGGPNSTIDHFLAFSISLIAYVAPYFFLPALFKAAGGLFSNLTGMVNNTGKGFFDKAKGGLDAKAKARATFKDQMGQERTARGAAGQGRLGEFGARFSRAKMRTKGGQPITGGALTLMNRQNVKQRVDSSMATTLSKLEQQQVEEETARLSRDGTLNDRNTLRARAVTGSIVQRRAAINQLMNIGDDDGMRFVAGASANHADRAVTEMWSKVRSSEDYAKAFKDKAPDLTAPALDLAFGDIKPSAIPGLSGSTIDKIFQYHAANISSADPDVASKAKQSMDRFLSSVQGALKDDFLRNQLSANNMMALSGNIVAAGLGGAALPTGGTVSAKILSHIDASGASPKDTDIIKETTPGSGVGPLGLKPVKITAPRPTTGTGKVT